MQQTCIIGAALLAGWLADRYGHAKRWVLAGSLVQGAGLLILAAAATMPGALVGVATVGLAQGVLVSVGLALALQFLPDPANAAKDLGVLNIAAGPGALAPAIGPADRRRRVLTAVRHCSRRSNGRRRRCDPHHRKPLTGATRPTARQTGRGRPEPNRQATDRADDATFIQYLDADSDQGTRHAGHQTQHRHPAGAK